MQHFEFLPHTADIRMRVEASTLQELFHAALEGMNAILFTAHTDFTHSDDHAYPVQLTSLDTTTLLIDFLSDALTASYEQKALFHTMQINQLSEKGLNALLHGHAISQFDEDIKAVTYHEADIHRNANGNWETVVIFDI